MSMVRKVVHFYGFSPSELLFSESLDLCRVFFLCKTQMVNMSW